MEQLVLCERLGEEELEHGFARFPIAVVKLVADVPAERAEFPAFLHHGVEEGKSE